MHRMATWIPAPDRILLHEKFEALYRRYNRREFVHPDPLEYVLRFQDPADQEIAGLVAAGLAYGRVAQILKSLETVFATLQNPSEDLEVMSREDLISAFRSFRHRWIEAPI